MISQPRTVSLLSRRSLVATGVGWILSAAGLLLTAAGNVAQARKGKNKGHNGKNDTKDNKGSNGKNSSKNQKKKEARVRAESFKAVSITFVNGTSSSEVSISRYGTQTERQVGPGQQDTLSAAGSAQHPVATFTAGDQSYVLYAQNPMIGLPWVKILDRNTDGLVFNEELQEGEQANSDLFQLQRTADTAETKEFVLTLLRAPDSGAAASTAEAGNGSNGGKGKKGKKGGKGGKKDHKQRGQDQASGNDGTEAGKAVVPLRNRVQFHNQNYGSSPLSDRTYALDYLEGWGYEDEWDSASAAPGQSVDLGGWSVRLRITAPTWGEHYLPIYVRNDPDEGYDARIVVGPDADPSGNTDAIYWKGHDLKPGGDFIYTWPYQNGRFRIQRLADSTDDRYRVYTVTALSDR